MLARQLRVATGDEIAVELLEGRRSKGRLRVAGVVDDFLGLSAYMSREALDDLAGGPRVISGAYLSVAADALPALNTRLKNVPAVAGVASPASTLAAFESQLAETLFIGVGFLLGFASVIAVGVIYNGARISLSERGRELASLRVMGFRRGDVAVLLLGEQAVVTLFAIPLGWAIGYLLALALSTSMETEAYRIPFVVSARTYGLAAAITIGVAVASGWIVRRRIDRLDLIAVLKTRE
jgi:putative ABC transport system permease protein